MGWLLGWIGVLTNGPWEHGLGGAVRCSRSLPTRSYLVVDMASALLRRQLARNVSLSHRRFLSRSSPALAQSASQDPITATPGAYSKHIAEDLQGISASDILAESGTRKDVQMRHFTGETFQLPSKKLVD